jgi:hypothetical protein
MTAGDPGTGGDRELDRPFERGFEQLIARLPAAVGDALRTACLGAELHAEACWHRHDPEPDAVIGLVGGPPARVVELARRLAPATADRIARWLDATPGIVDVGAKLGHHGLQVYARGRLLPAGAAAGFAAAGVATHPVASDNLLALLEQPDLAMVGLELDADRPDRIEGAIYASVARRPDTTAAVRDAFGFLVRVVAPDQLEAWDACAMTLLESPRDEIVYVSLSASLDWPWAKLDVSARPLAVASRLAEELGIGLGAGAIDGVLAAARALGGTAWSHVGVRFGSSAGPVFYLPVHGDRD